MQIERTRKISKDEIKLFVNAIVTGLVPYIKVPFLRHSKTKSVSSKSNNFIILREASLVYGFLMYRIEWSIIYIYELHVIEKFRSRGYGRRLMEELFESEKNKSFVLFVHAQNLRAQKLYRSLGFVTAGENGNYFQMFRNSYC